MKKLICIFIIINLFLVTFETNLLAITKVEKNQGSMIIDVPIRIISLGFTVVSSTLFIIALPFTIPSGSVNDSWRTLVVEPYKFTFKRPLGQFEDWETKNSLLEVKDE